MGIRAKLWAGFKDYNHFTFGNYHGDFGTRIGAQFIEECGGKNLAPLKEELNKSLFTKQSHPNMSWAQRRSANKAIKKEFNAHIKKEVKINRELIKKNYKNTSLFNKSKSAETISNHFNAAKKASKPSGFGAKFAKYASKVPFIGKFLKKAGPVAVIWGGVELLMLNSEAKEHNVKASARNYAKTGVRFLAEMGGFAAGTALGSALAAAGSVVPVVGTAIGFVAGFIIGGIAGWAAKKLAGGILGKTDLDRAKEQTKQTLEYHQGGGNELDQYFAQMQTPQSFAGMYSYA